MSGCLLCLHLDLGHPYLCASICYLVALFPLVFLLRLHLLPPLRIGERRSPHEQATVGYIKYTPVLADLLRSGLQQPSTAIAVVWYDLFRLTWTGTAVAVPAYLISADPRQHFYFEGVV